MDRPSGDQSGQKPGDVGRERLRRARRLAARRYPGDEDLDVGDEGEPAAVRGRRRVFPVRAVTGVEGGGREEVRPAGRSGGHPDDALVAAAVVELDEQRAPARRPRRPRPLRHDLGLTSPRWRDLDDDLPGVAEPADGEHPVAPGERRARAGRREEAGKRRDGEGGDARASHAAEYRTGR